MFASLFILLFLTLVLGVLLHAGLCRALRGMSAYALAVLALNGTFALTAAALWAGGVRFDAGALAVGLVFVESFTLAYLFFLIGIVNQSPTLALVRRIEEQSDAAPVTNTEIARFIENSSFVATRVSGLQNSSDLIRKGDRVELSPRARQVARVIGAYRWLVGSSQERAG